MPWIVCKERLWWSLITKSVTVSNVVQWLINWNIITIFSKQKVSYFPWAATSNEDRPLYSLREFIFVISWHRWKSTFLGCSAEGAQRLRSYWGPTQLCDTCTHHHLVQTPGVHPTALKVSPNNAFVLQSMRVFLKGLRFDEQSRTLNTNLYLLTHLR